MVSIHSYLDYRLFLRDYFNWRKIVSPCFSHRFIENRLSMSTGYFSKLLTGQRIPSERYIIPLALLFRLTKEETEYFYKLIDFARLERFKKNRGAIPLTDKLCVA